MELKSYLILLIFLIILLSIFSFTAFFYLALQIDGKEIICISFFHPPKAYEFENFEFLVRCENCGSVASDYHIEILIYNNNFFRRVISSPITVNPSQFLEYSVNFSLPRGLYNVSVRCLSLEAYKQGLSQIEILPKPIPLQPSIPSAPIILPKKYEVEMTYPKIINVSQGDTIDFFIKVVNKGDALSDVSLNYSSELKFKIKYPALISKLMFNETLIFSIELNVTYDVLPNIYPSIFCLLSKEIEKCFEIEINVTKSQLLDRIEKLIDFYEKLLRELSIEINNLELQEKNVEKAKLYLENASAHLLYSKNFLRFKLLEESLKELENVRKFASMVITEISKLYLEKIPKYEEKIYYAIPIRIILYFLISITLAFLIFVIAKKIKKYLEYRNLYSIKLRRLKLKSF